MAENLVNNARTNLNGAINTSVTSITVTNGAVFPTTGNFRIGIDAEIMLATAVSGNVVTVTRGAESTTAASHADGSVVAAILTAAGLAQYITEHGGGNTTSQGAAGSLPAAGNSGNVYLTTDQALMFRDDGTNWNAFGPIYPLNLPKLSDWTWFNQGSLTTSGGAANNAPLYVSGPNSAIAFLYKAVPTAPYSAVYGWQFNPNRQTDPRSGPCWYDTSGHNLTTISFDFAGPSGSSTPQFLILYITQWTSSGATFSSHALAAALWPMNMLWCKVRDDNTDRYVDLSVDGFNYINIYSTSRTTWLTPTSIGMHFYSNNGSVSVGTTWWHYKEGS